MNDYNIIIKPLTFNEYWIFLVFNGKLKIFIKRKLKNIKINSKNSICVLHKNIEKKNTENLNKIYCMTKRRTLNFKFVTIIAFKLFSRNMQRYNEMFLMSIEFESAESSHISFRVNSLLSAVASVYFSLIWMIMR